MFFAELARGWARVILVHLRNRAVKVQTSEKEKYLLLLSPFTNELFVFAIFCWQPPLNSVFRERLTRMTCTVPSPSEPLVYQKILKSYWHFFLTAFAYWWCACPCPLLCIKLVFNETLECFTRNHKGRSFQEVWGI